MENINLIRKIAWSFHHSTNEDFDDLFQEAALAYYEALKNYDPERGSIAGYMYSCITSHLKDNYLYKQGRWNDHVCSIEDNPVDVPVSYDSFFESLSREASEIADVILSSPKIFVASSPKSAKRRIASVMHRKKHWTWRRISIGLHDLKLAFS